MLTEAYSKSDQKEYSNFKVDYLEKNPNLARQTIEVLDTFQKYTATYALTDEMTGLRNKTGFMSKLEDEILNVKRALKEPDSKGSCIVDMDLRDFKSINDTYGHLAGDQALQAAADKLKEVFRENDIIGRLGGDEFAVIMKGTDAISAIEKTQKLYDAFKGEEGLPVQVTDNDGNKVSINVHMTAAVSCIDSSLSADDNMNLADQGMYEIKKQQHEHFGASRSGQAFH